MNKRTDESDRQTILQAQARALGDPTRYRIYGHAVDVDRPVDVAELTNLLGLNHNAVRQHLTKLVDAELLSRWTEPPDGPGRPRLLFRVNPASEERWGNSGPYRRLSVLLVDMIATGRTAVDVGREAGHRIQVGDDPSTGPIPQLEQAIARGGFDPHLRQRGPNIEFVLKACPFADAADIDPDTVCDLHLGLAQGLADQLEGITVDELTRADPHRAGCRLRFHTE